MSPLLVEAVLVWTGWGRDITPRRDDSLLINHFGTQVASKLLPVIKSLEDDFYSSNASDLASDIQEMGKMSAVDFRKKYPEIAEEIVQAFVWCYTYDYK